LRPAPAILLPSSEAAATSAQVDEKPDAHVAVTLATESEIVTPRPEHFPDDVDAEVDQAPAKQAPTDTDVPMPTGAANVQLPKMRQPRFKSAKRKSVDPIAQIPVVAGDALVSDITSPAANPAFQYVASLDEDIKQLKDQLTQKLRMQNAQLRKMLERFERS
jgi:hypothetical protein